jgi:hypothetical protein
VASNSRQVCKERGNHLPIIILSGKEILIPDALLEAKSTWNKVTDILSTVLKKSILMWCNTVSNVNMRPLQGYLIAWVKRSILSTRYRP